MRTLWHRVMLAYWTLVERIMRDFTPPADFYDVFDEDEEES